MFVKFFRASEIFSFKINDLQHDDGQSQADDRPAAVLPAPLGHAGKIHAVLPGEEGRGRKRMEHIPPIYSAVIHSKPLLSFQ